jgi:hypothetical protein
VPLDNFWNKTAEPSLADLRAANNPNAGQPNGPAEVELTVDVHFPATIPGVAPALAGRAAHPHGRNRLMLDQSAAWFRDARLTSGRRRPRRRLRLRRQFCVSRNASVVPCPDTMKRLFLLPFLALAARGADADWPAYLGDKASSHYSTLRQITPRNVTKLEVAWTYQAGGADKNNRSQIQCNPLVVDGVFYGTTPDLQAFALDAAAGRELWRFNPASVKGVTKAGVNRGLVFWHEGSDRRLLYANDRFLHALDAATGQRIAMFGDGGTIDLKRDLGRDVSGLALQSTTPGVVFGDLLIMGMRLGEGPAPAAPGHIRAYSIRTGKLVWRFNSIPQPGEPGHETWPPNAYQYVGGVNVWTGFALDEKRGLVFCPTGSAATPMWRLCCRSRSGFSASPGRPVPRA